MLIDPNDPFEALFQRLNHFVGSVAVALLFSTTVGLLTKLLVAKMVN